MEYGTHLEVNILTEDTADTLAETGEDDWTLEKEINKEEVEPQPIDNTIFATEDHFVEAIFTSASETVEENQLTVDDTVVVKLNSLPPAGVDLPVRISMEARRHGFLPLEIGNTAVKLALIA